MLRDLLREKGRLVIVGGEGGGRLFGPMGRYVQAGITSLFSGQKLSALFAVEKQADLVVLAGLLESGAITPAIDRVFPLEETPDAVRHLAAARHAGKVLIAP